MMSEKERKERAEKGRELKQSEAEVGGRFMNFQNSTQINIAEMLNKINHFNNSNNWYSVILLLINIYQETHTYGAIHQCQQQRLQIPHDQHRQIPDEAGA